MHARLFAKGLFLGFLGTVSASQCDTTGLSSISDARPCATDCLSVAYSDVFNSAECERACFLERDLQSCYHIVSVVTDPSEVSAEDVRKYKAARAECCKLSALNGDFVPECEFACDGGDANSCMYGCVAEPDEQNKRMNDAIMIAHSDHGIQAESCEDFVGGFWKFSEANVLAEEQSKPKLEDATCAQALTRCETDGSSVKDWYKEQHGCNE